MKLLEYVSLMYCESDFCMLPQAHAYTYTHTRSVVRVHYEKNMF
jgi:hypothetical protein